MTAASNLGKLTIGIVVKAGGRKIALYLSGRRHAGENLAELLTKRDKGLTPPIQMSECAASRTIESLTQSGEVQRNTSGSSD